MNTNDLAIATITWARDDREEQLLRTSLQQLAALKVPVYITDGGSNHTFLEFLKGFSNFILFQNPVRGVWAQAKNSVEQAYNSGAAFIFYTEPDKQDFFQQALPRLLNQIEVHEQTGIITASRSANAFTTFPSFQQMTEITINNCCAEIMGASADYTYGPFLLTRKIVPYLNLVQEDIGWGWRPYAFSIAHRLGYELKAVEGDFFCPADQREDSASERLYRMRQLSQNIQGLVLSKTVNLES